MKLGIIIDSSANMTKVEAKERQWGYLPLHISMNGENYEDGVDIFAEDVIANLSVESNAKTSITSPGVALEVFKEMSKEYDQVIVYPVSSELSSQYSHLKMLSNDFNNIHVINSKTLSFATQWECMKAEEMAKNNSNIEEIVETLEKRTSSTFGLVIPHTLQFLVKSGRVNSSIAKMANLFKIIPIVKFSNGKLDKHGKGRSFSKSIVKSAKFVKEHFKNKDIIFGVLHSGSKKIEEYCKLIFEATGMTPLVEYLPTPVIAHLGQESVGIFAFEK